MPVAISTGGGHDGHAHTTMTLMTTTLPMLSPPVVVPLHPDVWRRMQEGTILGVMTHAATTVTSRRRCPDSHR